MAFRFGVIDQWPRLVRAIFRINQPRDFRKFWNFGIFKNALGQFIPNHPPKHVQVLILKYSGFFDVMFL